MKFRWIQKIKTLSRSSGTVFVLPKDNHINRGSGVLSQISPADKVSIVGIARSIQAEFGTQTISSLAAQLGVALMSESRNRKDLVARLQYQEEPEVLPQVPSYTSDLLAKLFKRSGAIIENKERRSYAEWFKGDLLDLHDKGASWPELAALTGISLDTIQGFASHQNPIGKREPISPLHEQMAEIWKSSATYHRRSLENFWLHLQRRHRYLTLTYKEMRLILIDLGLYGQRGPKAVNRGAQVKKAFGPHAIWEGDAKQIKVQINGELFTYYWYAFVDQTTTLLVGSTVGPTESSQEFLEALRNGGSKQDTFPIGVLIDNRLEGSDLGPIRDFCEEHKIELLRIFPGSSKTNGNIENNFSIFETQVGSLVINGVTPQEIGKAIAQSIIEVFTQLRNNRRRKRLEDLTPAEAAENSKRPEYARTEIESLANRFEAEHKQIDQKWCIISKAREHFGSLSEESQNKIKGELGKYPVKDIIAAQASYIAQCVKYSDRRYGPEYFLAILRHMREGIAKNTYNQTFRAGAELKLKVLPRPSLDLKTTATGIIDYLIEVQNEATPAHRMMRLDALCWWLIGLGTPECVAALWRCVGDCAAETQAMTLRWWVAINEYVTDHIGLFVHTQGPPSDIITHRS